MLPGQHVTAVFGFCDIRKFEELTDVLRGQVMPFVNQIAKIVHDGVADHGGAPNKNIGDAFLCVWKTEEFHETPSSKDEEDDEMTKIKMRRLSIGNIPSQQLQNLARTTSEEVPEEYKTQADKALNSFLGIIEALRSRRYASCHLSHSRLSPLTRL